MAEAFFNKMSEGRHKGISAGSNPASQVNPIAVEAMKEVGIDIGGKKPKKLNKEMIMEAEIAITMGCGEDTCPIVPNELRDWDLEDPKDKILYEVRKIREEIKNRIEALIKELDEKT